MTPATAGEAAGPKALLTRAVDAYRRRLTQRTLLARLVVVVALLALAPLLMVVADHAWSGGVPRPVLTGALIAWVGGLAAALLGVLIATLGRRLNRVFVARQLERVSRIRHNSLVNALLLFRSAELAYAGEAVSRQAARDVAAHPPSKALEPRRDRRVWLAPLATAAVWVLYTVLSPKPVGPSLARFLGADQAAPTATRLELVRPGPGDVTHAGEALEIEIAVHGRSVPHVRFEVLEPGADSDTPLRKYVSSRSVGDAADRYRFVLAPFEVQEDIRYRCTAGDGRLCGVIPIQPQPDVESLEIVLQPPAYTGLPCETVTEPDLNVLAGTRASFRVTANAVVSDPVLVFRAQRETRTRMHVDPQTPRVASLALTMRESGTYHIEFSDPWGYPYRDPPQHRVEVREDTPPKVEITLPARGEAPGEVVDVTRFPELVAVADDDVRVAELALVLERDGEPHRVVVSAGQTARRRVIGRVGTAGLPLEPGREVQAWFEATDGRVLPGGRVAPQVAKSRVLTLLRPQEAREPERPADRLDTPATRPASPPGGETDADSPEPLDEPESEQEPGSDENAESQDQPESGQKPEAAERGDPHGADRPPEDKAERDDAGAKPVPGEQPSGDDFEGELDEFVREHGEEAEELTRRLRENGAQQDGTDEAEPRAAAGERDARDEGDDGEGGRREPSETGSREGDQSDRQEGPGRDSASEGANGQPDAEPQPKGANDAPPQRGTAQPEQPGTEARKPGEQPSRPGSEAGLPGGQTEQPNGATGQPSGQPGQLGGAADRPADQPGESAGEGKQPGARQGRSAEGSPDSDGQTPVSDGLAPGQPGGSTGGEQQKQRQEPEAESSGGNRVGAPGRGEEPAKGGGAAGGGTGATGRDRVPASAPTDPESPLTPVEPGKVEDSAPLDSTGRSETLDLLEMLERGENVTEDMLVEFGWPTEKAAPFIKALQRLREVSDRSGGLARLRREVHDTRVGRQGLQTGHGLSDAVRRGTDPAEATRDGLRRIAPPPEQRVPDCLEDVLEAYYRSLAAHRTRDEP